MTRLTKCHAISMAKNIGHLIYKMVFQNICVPVVVKLDFIFKTTSACCDKWPGKKTPECRDKYGVTQD